jgi:multiple sugar transport system permease protein
LNKRTCAGILFLLPALAYVLLFFGYPLFDNIRLSFEDYTVKSFYTGQAPFIGLDNYSAIFHNPLFGQALLNTVLFTVGSLACQFAIGLALALFFNGKFLGSSLLRALLLLPWLLPLVVGGAIWRWMMDQDHGVINTLLHWIGFGHVPWLSSPSVALTSVIIVNVWIGIPFNLVILHGGLQAIPESLYEAAALDGANAWQRFRNVTWPLLRPVTLITLMLGLVYTLKVFDVIQTVTGGGPANATQTLTTLAYSLSFRNFSFGQGAAVGNVLILLATFFGFIYLRAQKETLS